MLPDITYEEELHLLALVHDKKSCPWTHYANRFGYICETQCPVRIKVTKSFNALMAAREHNKYEREYPDEN
jgi:hypothetical protein